MNEGRTYFFNLAISAFMSQGHTTIGNGILYNDIGILDEIQADPNSSFNAYHRLSNDRAFVIKMSGGYFITKKLLLSGTLRYRDGEPFYAHEVIDTNYGLVKKNTDDIFRYTFALNVDLRLKYRFQAFKKDLEATMDLYNVFGSNTELKENSIAGQDLRTPIEAVPPRTFMFALRVDF